jgi:NDP-sugar pyrophosphorylase family protein
MKTRLWKKLNREFYKEYRIIVDPTGDYVLYHYDDELYYWRDVAKDGSFERIKNRLEEYRRQSINDSIRWFKVRSKKHYISTH